MKAIVLAAYGDADQLELRDIPEPTVGEGDVAVRMRGASLNPVDWKLRSGALKSMMPLELPAVLGRDVSGEVAAVGAKVTQPAIGARVMGLVNRGYAELVVAPAALWTLVPEGMDLVDASALPLVLVTGAQLVEEAVKPKSGDRVLVTGALGSVGRVAVFLAKARGARVYAGVRAAQKKAATAELGADGVIALDDPQDVDKLTEELDAIADTIGGDSLRAVVGKLKRGGVLGTVVGPPSGLEGREVVVRAMFAHPDAKRVAELAQSVADGKLVIPIARRFALAEAREAHRFAERGAGGKVLLRG